MVFIKAEPAMAAQAFRVEPTALVIGAGGGQESYDFPADCVLNRPVLCRLWRILRIGEGQKASAFVDLRQPGVAGISEG